MKIKAYCGCFFSPVNNYEKIYCTEDKFLNSHSFFFFFLCKTCFVLAVHHNSSKYTFLTTNIERENFNIFTRTKYIYMENWEGKEEKKWKKKWKNVSLWSILFNNLLWCSLEMKCLHVVFDLCASQSQQHLLLISAICLISKITTLA